MMRSIDIFIVVCFSKLPNKYHPVKRAAAIGLVTPKIGQKLKFIFLGSDHVGIFHSTSKKDVWILDVAKITKFSFFLAKIIQANHFFSIGDTQK